MATPNKQPEHRRDAPVLCTRAAVRPESVDVESRTVDVMWSTGADVMRYDWWTGERYIERLSMDPKHIRMDRLNSGAPLLDSHSSYGISSVLGVVEEASSSGKEGIARVRFSSRDDVEPAWRDVQDGIIRSLSVGYLVHEWRIQKATEKSAEIRTAIDWEPYELSLVAIPADRGAQVRGFDEGPTAGQEVNEMSAIKKDESAPADNQERSQDQSNQSQLRAVDDASRQPEHVDSATAVSAERKRIAGIVEVCRKHGIEASQQDAWIERGASVESVKIAILDGIAERSAASSVQSVSLGDGRREQSMVRDMAATLLRRAGEKVEGEGHRYFGDGNLMDLARHLVEAGGTSTLNMSRDSIARHALGLEGRAMGTSEFSSVLNLVGEVLVRSGYDSMPLVHRAVFRRATASDFKNKNRPVTAGATILEEVPESGRVQQYDGKAEVASYAIKTYAGIVAVTRKLIIDDNFDFVSSMSRQRGRSAAETERKVVWDFVNSNPTAPDGNSVFDNTNHGNFPAASGTPISATTLSAARRALREALSPDGFEINANLAHIVVSSVGEVDFDQLLNGMYVPTSQATAVTPRMRQVQLHIEPLVSATKRDWYGFADYNQVDTFEYAYLAGSEGPRLEQRMGFEVEGIELKVALDFGVGVIDHRGCFKQRET